jgi:ATP-binding cassette subfamily F protein 3
MIGPNGSGKTTLLKIMAGELAADRGEVSLGHRVTPSYYAQHHAETLHPDRTAFQEVAAHDPSGSRTRVQTILGAFLFSGDDVEKLTRVLSGGERSRLALARILVAPGNLLLMDEPTNHLDLDSSDALAEALATYDGTLVFVSHNRSFVRRLATRTWDVEGGRVETYPGTLDEYLAWQLERRDPSAVAKRAEPTDRPRDRERDRKRAEAERRAKRSRALRPLKAEVERLEKEIAEIEAAQKARSAELADPAVYAAPGRGGPLLAAYQEDADRLASALEAWEAAVANLEQAEAELGDSQDVEKRRRRSSTPC